MHFRYLVPEQGHLVVHETDATVVTDDRYHLVIRPLGAKFTIDIPRVRLLGCSVDNENTSTSSPRS